MKIYLLDRNDEMCQYWSKAFHDTDNVTVIHDDFEHFIKANEEAIDAVVSPANSFGIMDGAYDLAITRSFGRS